KRMRFLESAAVECGLPQRIVHAGIKRPIYGMCFVRNMPDVIWRGAEPEWLVDRRLSAEEDAQRATERWRLPWGGPGAAGAGSMPLVPGLASVLGRDDG